MLSEGNGAHAVGCALSEKVLRKCRESVEVKEKFFNLYAEPIAELCEKMAGRFQEGRELWVMGNGGSACDAQHVAVEFIHPIIEKRRALPARDLVSQIPVLTAISNDKDYAKIFVDQLDLWSQAGGHGPRDLDQRTIAQSDLCLAGGAEKRALDHRVLR